jgi:hypothetical protein
MTAAGLSAVAAGGSWLTADRARKTAERMAGIERDRWHEDLTPRLSLRLETGPDLRLTVRFDVHRGDDQGQPLPRLPILGSSFDDFLSQAERELVCRRHEVRALRRRELSLGTRATFCVLRRRIAVTQDRMMPA